MRELALGLEHDDVVIGGQRPRRRDARRSRRRRRRPGGGRPRRPLSGRGDDVPAASAERRRSLSTELMWRRVAGLGGIGVAGLDRRRGCRRAPASRSGRGGRPASRTPARSARAAARRRARGSCCRRRARSPGGTGGGHGRRGRCRWPPSRRGRPRTSGGSRRAARRPPLGGELGGERLQHAAQFEQLDRPLRIERGDVRTAPRPNLDEAGVLERPDRLAHRVARHAELLGETVLEQPLTGLELAGRGSSRGSRRRRSPATCDEHRRAGPMSCGHPETTRRRAYRHRGAGRGTPRGHRPNLGGIRSTSPSGRRPCRIRLTARPESGGRAS